MIFDMAKDFDRRKAGEYLAKLTAKEKGQVELKQIRRTRSNRQNNWLHAVVKEVSDFTGYETDEAKTIIKRKNGLAYQHGKTGEWFLRSTASLDTADFAAFMDRVMRWAAQELDLYLPDPERF